MSGLNEVPEVNATGIPLALMETRSSTLTTASSSQPEPKSPALLTIARSLGRDAARRTMARRGYGLAEMVLGLLIISALLALALALLGQ